MFHLKNQKNTKQEQLKTILQWIDEAEAVVIGGASGMSTACGFDYYTHHTPFFKKYFSDPIIKSFPPHLLLPTNLSMYSSTAALLSFKFMASLFFFNCCYMHISITILCAIWHVCALFSQLN